MIRVLIVYDPDMAQVVGTAVVSWVPQESLIDRPEIQAIAETAAAMHYRFYNMIPDTATDLLAYLRSELSETEDLT
jgi:hypothetical protein